MKDPRKVFVIQMGNLSDLLQTLMALRAAQQLYPQMKITLLGRECYLPLLGALTWIHEVLTLPEQEAFLEGDYRTRIQRIAGWVRPHVQTVWDLVVNWSFSESSSYLTGLLPARCKLGYSRRRDLSLLVHDGWSQYLQSVVHSGIRQDIHLTDILTTQLLTALQIQWGEPQDPGDSKLTSRDFFGISNDTPNKTERIWTLYLTPKGPSIDWVEFLGQALEGDRQVKVLIVHDGIPNVTLEALVAALSESHRSRVELHRVASVLESLELLRQSSWILASDPAVWQLASTLGIRVFGWSQDESLRLETGPYGNSHWLIANPDLSSFLAAFSYATSEWAHRRSIGLSEYAEAHGWTLAQNLNVYRSRIRSSQEGGGVYYEPLISRPLSLEDWNAQVLGYLARSWYCGWTPEMGNEISRESLTPQFLARLFQMEDSAKVLMQICEEGARTARLIHEECQKLPSDSVMSLRDHERLQGYGKKLVEMDQLLDRLTATEPALLAFSHLSKVLMHNLSEGTLSQLGKEANQVYRMLSQGVKQVLEWIETTRKIARPRSLPPNNLVRAQFGRAPSEEALPS
jgi:hypothetical protein